MKCGYTLCRYNKDKDCTHEDKGAECHYVLKSVLDVNDGCEFCHGHKNKNKNKRLEVCKEMKLHKTANETDMRHCRIFLHETESPALMIIDRFGCGAFLDIEFCPMCGRKLT
jgi:hypothetical protein